MFRKLFSAALYPIFWLISFPPFFGLLESCLILVTKALGVNNAYMHSSGITVGEWKFLRRLCLCFPKNPCVLDVGLNEGAYSKTVLALRPDAKVIGFEPNPKLIARHQGNSGFSLIAKAVSDIDSRVAFYDVHGGNGTSLGSLHREQIEIWNHEEVDCCDVETITLDAFACEREIERIDLLKVDTEGHDIHALRGAKELLSAGRIDVIQFEFIRVNAFLHVMVKDFFDLLDPLYDLFRLNVAGRLIPLGVYRPLLHELYGSQNLIAIRKSSDVASKLRIH